MRKEDQTLARMRGRWLSTLLRGAVLIPLFLAAVLPDSARTLVCRYTGVAMPEESCCPVQQPEPGAPDRMQDESCCVVKTVHLERLLSDRQSSADTTAHHEMAVSFAPMAPYIVARSPDIRRITVSAVGPPILLVKSAFLI